MMFIKNKDGSYTLCDPIKSDEEESRRPSNFSFNSHSVEESQGIPYIHDPELFSLQRTNFSGLMYQEQSPISPIPNAFPRMMHLEVLGSSPTFGLMQKIDINLSCHTCQKIFRHRGDLLRHTQNVHSKRTPCAFCGKHLKISKRSDATIKHFSRCPRFMTIARDKSLGMHELGKRAYHLIKHEIPVTVETLKNPVNEIHKFGKSPGKSSAKPEESKLHSPEEKPYNESTNYPLSILE